MFEQRDSFFIDSEVVVAVYTVLSVCGMIQRDGCSSVSLIIEGSPRGQLLRWLLKCGHTWCHLSPRIGRWPVSRDIANPSLRNKLLSKRGREQVNLVETNLIDWWKTNSEWNSYRLILFSQTRRSTSLVWLMSRLSNVTLSSLWVTDVDLLCTQLNVESHTRRDCFYGFKL